VAKVYIVSFRTHDDRRPSKFIVLADNMRSAINMAWEHGGVDFQSRFDKATGQAQEMKEGALRAFCEAGGSGAGESAGHFRSAGKALARQARR
jgi:hypothetical protein